MFKNIQMSHISGSMEFSIAGHPDDFFPVNVSFVSKKTYSDIEVSRLFGSLALKGNEPI